MPMSLTYNYQKIANAENEASSMIPTLASLCQNQRQVEFSIQDLALPEKLNKDTGLLNPTIRIDVYLKSIDEFIKRYSYFSSEQNSMQGDLALARNAMQSKYFVLDQSPEDRAPFKTDQNLLLLYSKFSEITLNTAAIQIVSSSSSDKDEKTDTPDGEGESGETDPGGSGSSVIETIDDPDVGTNYKAEDARQIIIIMLIQLLRNAIENCTLKFLSLRDLTNLMDKFYFTNHSFHQASSMNVPSKLAENRDHNQLMYLSDARIMLQNFMTQLSKIRQLAVRFRFVYTVYLTSVNVMHNDSNDLDDDDKAEKSYDKKHMSTVAFTPMTFSPLINKFLERNTVWKDTILQIDENADKVEFTRLVNIQDVIDDTPEFDLESKQGSNGLFSYFYHVVDNKYDLRKNLADIFKDHKIELGQIASRSALLKSIDLIFQTWLYNLQTVNYDCYICHCNCHGNSITDISACCMCGHCDILECNWNG